jgi:hypothetical protein
VGPVSDSRSTGSGRGPGGPPASESRSRQPPGCASDDATTYERNHKDHSHTLTKGGKKKRDQEREGRKPGLQSWLSLMATSSRVNRNAACIPSLPIYFDWFGHVRSSGEVRDIATES